VATTGPVLAGESVRVAYGDALCNRDKETSGLVRAMENGEKLFLFSEWRY
jgi:hypothetical protein